VTELFPNRKQIFEIHKKSKDVSKNALKTLGMGEGPARVLANAVVGKAPHAKTRRLIEKEGRAATGEMVDQGIGQATGPSSNDHAQAPLDWALGIPEYGLNQFSDVHTATYENIETEQRTPLH
jgi:hypothetical protein